jgi:hypothetical protein
MPSRSVTPSVRFGLAAALGLCLAFVAAARSADGAPATLAEFQPAQFAPTAPPEIDTSVFFDALAPYGEWIESPQYGWVWTPYDVPIDWRPYSNGHWAYTDYGWTWVSDYPWGWATFHYGRWGYLPDIGWVWAPGRVWAPAWVEWRVSDDVIGWAPLPPQLAWNQVVEIAPDEAVEQLVVEPHAWTFIPATQVLAPDVHEYVLDTSQVPYLLEKTRNITRYELQQGRIVNRGISLPEVERRIGHAVPRMALREVESPKALAGGRVEGNELKVYRPKSTQLAGHAESAKPFQPPHPPTPRAIAPHELNASQQIELQALEKKHAAEQQQLRARQEQEKAHAPANVTQDELQKRHEAELKAQQAEHERQRQLIQQQHKREQQAKAAHTQSQARRFTVPQHQPEPPKTPTPPPAPQPAPKKVEPAPEKKP